MLFCGWCALVLLPGISLAQDESQNAADPLAIEDLTDDETYFASFLQPRLQTPREAVAPEVRRSSRSSQRSSYVQLARAPNMFGDFFYPAGQMFVRQRTEGTVVATMPLGGGRSYKIGENNKPIPMDRVYFNYNGYVNANTLIAGPGLVPRSTNLNQFTLGFEKTFLDGWWSVDVRMPLLDGFQGAAQGFGIDSGRYGNMSAYLKHLMYQDDGLAIAAGCGIGLPTGSNLDAFIDGDQVTVQNDAVHLLPYIGFFDQYNDDWFLQGFFGLDFAANGNDIVFTQTGTNVGRYNEQNLMYADLSLGRWLYRNPEATYTQGLAAIFELHYTTAIQDSDFVVFQANRGGGIGTLSSLANRLDILNVTAGMHWQITPVSNFRVGCCVPVRTAPDRVFDAEILASFNRQF
jgi:hypothetical protein